MRVDCLDCIVLHRCMLLLEDGHTFCWVLSMGKALTRLVVVQFVLYAVFGVLGFVAWAMAFSKNLLILEMVFGGYFRGHLVRWTVQLPFWGVFILVSAFLSLCTAWLLNRSRREGAYLGVIAFLIGFVTNVLFARNILVHSLVGCAIGWTLLAPVAFLWKSWEEQP